MTKEMGLSVKPGLRAGRNCEIDCSGGVTIGARFTLSENAKIYTHDHVIDGGDVNWRKNGLVTTPLTIEDDVWVGAGAIILPKVRCLGQGSVIAAGSVVRDDVPPLAIVAGNPARVVRHRQIGLDRKP